MTRLAIVFWLAGVLAYSGSSEARERRTANPEAEILTLINSMNKQQMAEMGFHAKVIADVLASRPYADVQAFKDVSTVGALGYVRVMRYWQDNLGPRPWRDGLAAGKHSAATIQVPALIDTPNKRPCRRRDVQSILAPPAEITPETPAKIQILLKVDCTVEIKAPAPKANDEIHCAVGSPWFQLTVKGPIQRNGKFDLKSRDLDEALIEMWEDAHAVGSYCVSTQKQLNYIHLGGEIADRKVRIRGALAFDYRFTGTDAPIEELKEAKSVAPAAGAL